MNTKKIALLVVLFSATILVGVGCKKNLEYNGGLVQSIQDSNCKKYYDGCNTCEKMGMDEVCTEKYCSEFGEPKCLDESNK